MKPVPTLFEWIGGMPAIEKLFDVFYARVPADPLLAPVFAEITSAHAKHVAAFVAEVLGGPKTYSDGLGGHPHMIRRHVGRALTEPMSHPLHGTRRALPRRQGVHYECNYRAELGHRARR